MAVKTMTVLRIVWTIGPVAIELPRRYSRYEDVPVMRRAMEGRVESNDASWLRIVSMVKEDDLHSRGIGGKILKFVPSGVAVGPRG